MSLLNLKDGSPLRGGESMGPQWHGSRLTWLSATCLCVAQLLSPALADSQRTVQYEYDGAGNIVRIFTGDNVAPPTLTVLSPNVLNQDAEVTVLATGTDLAGVDVSTSAIGLAILNVMPISETQVRFSVRADASTPLGTADIVFTTALGNTTGSMLIVERLPIISSAPNPISLEVSSPPVSVQLIFDAPYAVERTFAVAVRDPAIAAVSQSSVTMPAGEVQVSVLLDGLALGVTSLDVIATALLQAVSVPVFVGVGTLPAGGYGVQSAAVGVSVFAPTPSAHSTAATSQAVGVAVYAPIASSLSVVQPSLLVGASFGPVADSAAPSAIGRGVSTTLILTGSGLDEVAAVQFVPDDGVTVTGALVPSVDGTELQVPVSVSTGAALGARVITLIGPQGAGPPNVELEITP